MQGRYEVKDLLKLRESPLVVKPPGLPPKEEWMGPIDSRLRPTAARGKIDDGFNQTEAFQKRPSYLDSTRRSTTDPERIHLGPPRNSFASSTTTRTRNGLQERAKAPDDDSKPTDRRTATFGGLNGKFGPRGDGDSNPSDRPRRRNDDDDDLEGRPRRDYDRSRWHNRDGQVDSENQDDPDRRANRESYSKSKFDQPWGRREKQADLDSDAPAWRRGPRDRDNDRVDVEPEWADSTEAPDAGKGRTHEDFLQWMEKMKNKSSADDNDFSAKELSTPVDKPPPRVISDSTASVDKFFAKFEEKKTGIEGQGGSKPTKSRFASIFGSKDETKADLQTALAPFTSPPPPAELEQPPATADPEKKANEAAFAKLLQMLNKNQAVSASPSAQYQPTKTPVNVAELASTRSPNLGNATFAQPPNRTPVSTHTPNLSLDRLIESRSPTHHAHQDHSNHPKAGATDLLELLRRSNVQEKPETQHYPQPGYLPHLEQRLPLAPPPPGLTGFPKRDIDRPGPGPGPGPGLISTRRDIPRSIFDDPAFTGYRGEQDYQQRNQPMPPPPPPPDHGGLRSFFTEVKNPNSYYPDALQEQRLPPPPSHMNAPPGLQRPPGLDNGPRPPPPGWPTNPQLPQPLSQQHQQQRQLISPPIADNQHPHYSLYSQNRNDFSQQQRPREQPPQPRQQIPQLQPYPQRIPTVGEHPMSSTYGNMPPPGFGPSPTSPDSAAVAMQYAIRGGYGLNERDRSQQQNAFAGMYGNGNGNGNGNRGGNGSVQVPPGFR